MLNTGGDCGVSFSRTFLQSENSYKIKIDQNKLASIKVWCVGRVCRIRRKFGNTLDRWSVGI